MKNVKYSVCEMTNGNNSTVFNSMDWFEANAFCEKQAEKWLNDGLIVDTCDGNEFMAHDPNNYDLVHDYLIKHEYIPQAGVINPSIKGYEFVKDVVFATGSERTGYDLLFAVKRNGDDYLRDLCEVAENTRENYDNLKARYSDEDYIIWHGCVRSLPKGAAVMPSGGDIIDFYWS